MADGAYVVIAGKLVVDELLWCAHPVVPGSNQRATEARISGGGQVWHTARALAELGVACRVTGWAGADADSAKLRARLRAEGIDDRLVSSGHAVRSTVLIGPDGDRAIVSRRGEGRVDARALIDAGAVDDACALHIDAFALDAISGDAIVGLAAQADERGLPVSLEPTSTVRLDVAVPWLRQLPSLDAIIGRPDEVDATVRVLGRSPRVLVTHDGPRPVEAHTPEGALRVVVPEASVATTGAGDRFAAGWLAARAEGRHLVEALEAGVSAAQAGEPGP
jgi:sugar/nucleoside kinase (ribokinase family)